MRPGALCGSQAPDQGGPRRDGAATSHGTGAAHPRRSDVLGTLGLGNRPLSARSAPVGGCLALLPLTFIIVLVQVPVGFRV